MAGFSYLEGYMGSAYWIELAIQPKARSNVKDYIAIIEYAGEKSQDGELNTEHVAEDGCVPVSIGISPIVEQEQGGAFAQHSLVCTAEGS